MITREKLEARRDAMMAAVEDSLVEDYAALIPGLALPDPDDRHVLAAAIKCEARIILTINLKDFPATTLQEYELTARHPDDFLSELLVAEWPDV
ncbi:MAG: PIN domain-containing protein, partial [Blastocatellia bacterium]